MNIKYLSFFIFCLIFSSCHKDSNKDFVSEENDIINPELDTEGLVKIEVYDSDLMPVSEVSITINNQLFLSNERGEFYFLFKDHAKTGTYIKVEKEGYFFGSDVIFPENEFNISRIQLLKINNTRNLNSTSGGIITVDNGGSISFDPNIIISQDGSPYNGDVVVTAIRLASDDHELSEKMPGNLSGTSKTGERITLTTLGMVAMELRDSAGKNLNLASQKEVTIVFPVSPDQQADAPATIPLWYFEEEIGLWKQYGEAILIGTDYVAKASGYSFWTTATASKFITYK